MGNYNKLVRDIVPEIIRQKGKEPVTYTANKEEYKRKLRDKLEEEVYEFLKNNDPMELIDILEVVYAIAETKGIGKDRLEELRVKKRLLRGGFENRIILLSVKD